MFINGDPQVVIEGNQGQTVFTVKNTGTEDADCDIPLTFKITGISLGDGGTGYHASTSLLQDNPLDDILTGSSIPAALDNCSGKTLNEGATCTFVQNFTSDDKSGKNDGDSGYWYLTNIVNATTVFQGAALSGNGTSLVVVTDVGAANSPEPTSLSLFTCGGILIAAGRLRTRKRAP
jgi:hypothetical protein